MPSRRTLPIVLANARPTAYGGLSAAISRALLLEGEECTLAPIEGGLHYVPRSTPAKISGTGRLGQADLSDADIFRLHLCNSSLRGCLANVTAGRAA